MRYRLLGPSGLRVSELALGTMSFGEDWGWGATKEESRAVFDAYVAAGGNFIDTACNYTEGTSERFVGEFIHDDRDRHVVATKYTLSTRSDDPNASGNSRKNLLRTVHDSLRRMNTDYIDLLWLHAWDGTTSIDEILRGLDDLVRQGKVHYVGISDTPAWIIARMELLARLRGWAPVVAVQLPYSLVRRDAERELLPMARALGLAVTAWGLLGGGVLSGKYSGEAAAADPASADPASADATPADVATDAATSRLDRERIPAEHLRIADVVVEVASEIGCTPAVLAQAWILAQQARAQVIPILGARTATQLEASLAAATLALDDAHLRRLDEASAIPMGFPTQFLAGAHVRALMFGDADETLERRRP